MVPLLFYSLFRAVDPRSAQKIAFLLQRDFALQQNSTLWTY